jgi:hypothetical protein
MGGAWRGLIILRFLLCMVTVAIPAALQPTLVAAAQPAGLTWSATINGRTVADVDSNEPLVLAGDGSTPIQLNLTNSGSAAIKVRSVRLEGRVMGMTFFRYTTRLDIVLAPGATTERRFDLDLDDLTGQAVGLIPAKFQLLDDRRTVVVEDSLPVHVRGSLTSVYGVFGLAVAGITAVLLISLLIALSQRKLPSNRWQRAVLFLAAGTGLGLTLTFTLSATRLLTPGASAWVSLVAIFGAGAFLLGYVLPLGTARPDPIDASEPEPEYEPADRDRLP